MSLSTSLKMVLPLVLMALTLSAPPLQADTGPHRVVFHVDENDPGRMNLVLNNASNVDAYYRERAEEVQIEIVAYGPGLHMLRADTSPVKDRVQSLSENFDNVSFMACGNTKNKMSKKANKEIELLPQAKMVPAGVVHLMERQQAGWSYIRP
jgi:intracellular sulfur oxidation DsrE/DsrF family protein